MSTIAASTDSPRKVVGAENFIPVLRPAAISCQDHPMALRMHLLVSGRVFVGASNLDSSIDYDYDDLDKWPDITPGWSNQFKSSEHVVLLEANVGPVAMRRDSIAAFWIQPHEPA